MWGEIHTNQKHTFILFICSLRMLVLSSPHSFYMGLLTPASLLTCASKWMKVTDAYLSTDFFPPDYFSAYPSSHLPFKSNWNLTAPLCAFFYGEIKNRHDSVTIIVHIFYRGQRLFWTYLLKCHQSIRPHILKTEVLERDNTFLYCSKVLSAGL